MTLSWGLARKRETLAARARIIQEIRRFFIEGGYLEVETPLRIPAPAPETHIDAIPSGDWFLQTSPELCMKRLLAAGCESIFQISHCWREGERGRLHLPEFTMLEWYRTGADYRVLMAECEALIRSLAKALQMGERIACRGNGIDLAPPWERITVRDAFARYGGMTMEEALTRDLFDQVMVAEIEPRLGVAKPTFICDYPAERGALARLRQDDPTVAERFELYIGGVELANAFSELTDPAEQRARFVHEAALRGSLGGRSYPLPEKFLHELAAMPPAAGIALGVDRLVMVLLDAAAIDEVVAFTPEEL
ncbi:MAG: EF-P lysine aminoacylase EpmA [Geobacteraceae bacterium]|nr:EF-P lysine aminoacylase EpmA [Geobacteraceae bacterium]